MKFKTQYPGGRKPLDMVGAADDPVRLMRALGSFIEYWFGERHPDYGISEGRLRDLRLPEPLKQLYALAGQWPSENYDGRLLATGRVHMLSLESLWIEDGRVVFACECEGGPWWATELGGIDPPVWMRSNEHGTPWKPLCKSLASFLVTFCLRAAISVSNHYGSGNDLTEYFQSRDLFVVPVWRDRPISNYDAEGQEFEFALAGGQILIENNRSCTTNCERLAQRFPDVFRPPSKAVPFTSTIWEHPSVPPFVLATILKQENRKHERLASEYEDRAAQHTRLAEFFRGKLKALPKTEYQT